MGDQSAQISIYTISGVKVLTSELSPGLQKISTQGFKRGTYVVQVQSDGLNQIRKLIIQ